MKLLPLLALALAALALPRLSSAAVETYAIDPAHSSVGFTIRNFLSKVPGAFAQFSGEIKIDQANPEKSSAEATIQVDSVQTGNAKRNAHLKTPDFFDAAKFGTIIFRSTSWKKSGDARFEIAGDLTMHGVTKSVVLQADLLGFDAANQGMKRVRWQATTTLKRADFGIEGPASVRAVLGSDVAVTLKIEADQKP